MKKVLHFTFKQLFIVCLLVYLNSQSLFAQNCPTKPNIQGPPAVCPGAVDIPYVVKDSKAIAWKWLVHPDTATVVFQESLVGIGDSILINWKELYHQGRTTTIRLISSYPNCPNDTTLYLVKISPVLQTPIPSGQTEICVGSDKIIEYFVPLIPHTTYQWYNTSYSSHFYPFGIHPTGNIAKVEFVSTNQNGAVIERIGVLANYRNPDPSMGQCNDDQVRILDIKVLPKHDPACITTEIKKNNQFTNFRVYPTIISDRINISLSSFSSGKSTIEISDVAGKKIWEKEISVSEGENTLNFTPEVLTKGIYVLSVYSSQSYKINQVIIKE